MLLGIIGLNVTKHLIIAYLCQVLGVDRRSKSKSLPASPTPRLPA
jgi:hypothetical protein